MGRRWYTYDVREYFHSEGINDAWWVTHRALGRESTDDSPYLIANEWICANIGTHLRLPVPPYALMKQGTTDGMFVSFKYGSSGVTPDDVNPAECVQHLPFLAAGIVLFDVLVANSDRHTSNLKVDRPLSPTEIEVFDHDHALLGAIGGRAQEHMNNVWDRLGTSGGTETGGNVNCLLTELDSCKHFGEWINRIELIPEWYLRELCNEVVGVSVTRDEADLAFLFLRHRRDNLRSIIFSNRKSFPKIKDWGIL